MTQAHTAPARVVPILEHARDKPAWADVGIPHTHPDYGYAFARFHADGGCVLTADRAGNAFMAVLLAVGASKLGAEYVHANRRWTVVRLGGLRGEAA